MAASCVFCAEARNPGYANAFLGADWPFQGRILVERDNIFMVPGYGPQVFPYSLIISRRHIVALSQTTLDERRDIFFCLDSLLSHPALGLQSLFVFEHAGCQNLESCVEHFHLHAISGEYDLRRALTGKSTTRITIDLDNTVEIPNSYLFCGLYTGDKKISGVVRRTRSKQDQFFRRALAEEIGTEAWDWRSGMNPQYMKRLVALIAKD